MCPPSGWTHTRCPQQTVNFSYFYERNLRPLRKSHVGQPPSAVRTLFSRRRGRLRYILIEEEGH
jgi:hypothetical protein